jgi:signal transduction histidine kinase/ActR/RegA family two-component response regulator
MKQSTATQPRRRSRTPLHGTPFDAANAAPVRRLDTPIREVMTRDVVYVFDDTTADALLELLLDRDLSGVPVVDRRRRLVGFVATTDIVRALHLGDDSVALSEARLPFGMHTELAPPLVAELMTAIAFELPESSSIANAIDLMASRRVHRVPVVSDDDRLVGIVTAGDIARYLARAERTAEAREAGRVADADAERVVALGFLASGLAHQISNALTPVRLGIGRLTSFELSRRPMSPSRLHRIELLQDVREGVDRVARIVRELRVFAHADDEPRAVEIGEVVELAMQLASHEIAHHAKLVLDEQPTPVVRARPHDLRQIVLNLLLNACRAIPEGEAHVNEIRVATRTDERGFAVIEVTDSGAGIPRDALPRIFEPFFTSERGNALGLGLSVTRDVVTMLGGDVDVASTVGQGTTVRIALPPYVADAAQRADDAAPRRDEAAAPARRRILIVDDDRPVAAAIALELGDHDVVVAESGREALAILRRDRAFDAILCDVMMPEVSGIDVYEALRLIDPDLVERVVLMTGGAFTKRASEFLARVETPTLEKPFEPDQLRTLVHAIDRRRAHDSGGHHDGKDG